MRINIEESAGLIIDIQEKLFPHIADHDQLAVNTGILIEGLKILEVPIVVTEQYVKGLGSTIPSISTLLKENKAFEKMSFSCCDEFSFSKELEQLNKKYIIIAGIESHVCVLQTAIDLMKKGYQAVVIEDCVSSRRINDKNISIARMRQEGVIISTYESILFELTKVSGNEKFKAISKLVK
ncbi:MAG: hydrolase [Bacteroidales bacterium]|nr:hydrolase [Bacteroidales bacterium]MCF8391832.1 hydrolase [Bacteroidales bacterium]